VKYKVFIVSTYYIQKTNQNKAKYSKADIDQALAFLYVNTILILFNFNSNELIQNVVDQFYQAMAHFAEKQCFCIIIKCIEPLFPICKNLGSEM
jgi:hypothetical protein